MGKIKSPSFDNGVKKTNYMFQGVPHSTFNFSWRMEITLELGYLQCISLCMSNMGIMCTQNNFKKRIIVMNC